jgi:hypothetical protein
MQTEKSSKKNSTGNNRPDQAPDWKKRLESDADSAETFYRSMKPGKEYFNLRFFRILKDPVT